MDCFARQPFAVLLRGVVTCWTARNLTWVQLIQWTPIHAAVVAVAAAAVAAAAVAAVAAVAADAAFSFSVFYL